MSKRKKRIWQFSMRSLILLATLLSVCLSVWIANRDHWEAVRVLRQRGDIEMVFSREQPNFIDRVLGDWRFDNVREIVPSGSASEIPEVSAKLIGDLRGLERFNFNDVNVSREENEDLSCLEPHLDTLKSLDTGYVKTQPPLLAEFTKLEKLDTTSPVDFSQLKSRSTLKSLSCSLAKVENLNQCENLTELSTDLSRSTPDHIKRKLVSLPALRSLSLRGNGWSTVDISWLVNADLNLTVLTFYHVNIRNADLLKELDELTDLGISFCILDKKDAFNEIPELSCLNLIGSGVLDLELVRNCKSLRYLVLEFGERQTVVVGRSKPGLPIVPKHACEIDLQVLESIPELEVCLLIDAKGDYQRVPKLKKLKYLECDLSDSKFEKLIQGNPGLKKWTAMTDREARDHIEVLFTNIW